MNSSLPLSNRYLRIGIVAIFIFIMLMFILAPATGLRNSGSTFNRAPEGYLGWYRYMETQGMPIQRWQRPLTDLLAQDTPEPETLLRIYPRLVERFEIESSTVNAWLAAGNDLVVLGIEQAVTQANFTTHQESSQGDVAIATRKRSTITDGNPQLLGDQYGAVVWQQQLTDAGTTTYAVTPHLAANAYQNEPGNYAFLADLVSQAGGSIWVDEYLHGYSLPGESAAADTETDQGSSRHAWITYLAQTPVKMAFIQIMILLGLFLWGQNQRFGNLSSLKTPKVDNSQAYIEALAAVLHKATSTSFLVDMIAKAERSALQKSLGFSKTNVDDTLLKAAWTQQTGQDAQLLTPLLVPPKEVINESDARLNQWLTKLRQIRQTPIR